MRNLVTRFVCKRIGTVLNAFTTVTGAEPAAGRTPVSIFAAPVRTIHPARSTALTRTPGPPPECRRRSAYGPRTPPILTGSRLWKPASCPAIDFPVRLPLRYAAASSTIRPAGHARSRPAAISAAGSTTTSGHRPGGGNNWTAMFFNPATGAAKRSRQSDVADKTIVIFVGGRNLAGSQAGIGGTGGYGASGQLRLVQPDRPARTIRLFSTLGRQRQLRRRRNWYFGSQRRRPHRQQASISTPSPRTSSATCSASAPRRRSTRSSTAATFIGAHLHRRQRRRRAAALRRLQPLGPRHDQQRPAEPRCSPMCSRPTLWLQQPRFAGARRHRLDGDRRRCRRCR